MEIRQIKHFLAVAETGSFTKGSEQAALSQPALSASIAKLEEELGVRLLDRTSSRVVPTAAGAKFLERAYSLLLIYNSLMSDVRGVAAAQPLRLGVLQSISSAAVSTFIGLFQHDHPDVVMEVIDGTEDDLLKRVSDGRLDAAFSTAPKDRGRKLESVALFIEHLMLALPRGHELARRARLSLEDLSDIPFIERDDCVGYYAFAKAMADRGIYQRVAYRTDRDDRALKLVSMGIGLSTIPGLYSEDGVILRSLVDFDFTRTVTLQWPADSRHAALMDFVAAARTHDWEERPAISSAPSPHPVHIGLEPGVVAIRQGV